MITVELGIVSARKYFLGVSREQFQDLRVTASGNMDKQCKFGIQAFGHFLRSTLTRLKAILDRCSNIKLGSAR